MITKWAQKRFSFALKFSQFVDSTMWTKMSKWEERYLAAKLLVGNDGDTRRRRAQATGGVVKAVQIMDRVILMRVLRHYTNGCCYICQQPLVQAEYDWDHVIPKKVAIKVMGHIVTSGNVMPVHSTCNHKKDERLPTKEELERARTAYDRAGLRFFDQDHKMFHTEGDRSRECAHPLLKALEKEALNQ